MSSSNRWEQQKRDLETEERVLHKVASLFSVSERDDVFSLFEELGEMKQPRLLLDILRGVELEKGSDVMEKLKQMVALAKRDPRDVWVVEYERYFNASVGTAQGEFLRLQAEDACEHLDWLLK